MGSFEVGKPAGWEACALTCLINPINFYPDNFFEKDSKAHLTGAMNSKNTTNSKNTINSTN